MTDHVFKYVVTGNLTEQQKEKVASAIALAVIQAIGNEPLGTSRRTVSAAAQRFTVNRPNGGWIGPIELLQDKMIGDVAKEHQVDALFGS
jgi:hypothetical protein